MTPTRDIENNLRLYMPFLFELLGDNNLKKKQWRKINENFKKDFEGRKAVVTANNYLRVEASLYDVIYSTLTGDESAYRMFEFINIVLIRLNKYLSVDEKAQLKTTIFNVLSNFDHKYRNFIGELAALNAMNESGYKLIAVEKDFIAGGRTADFTVYKNDRNDPELVEVVNIHFDETDEDLERLLLGKINKKIAEKIGNATTYRTFNLMPVLWAFPKDLKRLQEMYKAGFKINVPNVHEPFAYCSFRGETIENIHRFCAISNLYTDEIIQLINPYADT